MEKSIKKGLLAGATIIAIGLSSLAAFGQDEEPFAAKIEGRKTWTIRYGFGDPIGLASAGIAPGQISLDQTLAVDIHGEALSVLTIEGHFDDQQPESMQTLTVYLDTDRLDGAFGDFTMEGLAPFAAHRRKMKGGRLDYTIGDATITAIGSRFEGIAESRTFIGETSSSQVLYSASLPDRPWVSQPYTRNIAGLYGYPLGITYVPDFTDVTLFIPASDGLGSLLSEYSLSYLVDWLSANEQEKIDEKKFAVIGGDRQTLVLKVTPNDLLRARIKEGIDAYNLENGLSGPDAEEYPFNVGSEYEVSFLSALAGQAKLLVGSEEYELTDGVRHRFYDLGQTGVVTDSVVVEVSLDGIGFTAITYPDYADYDVTVYPDEGIIEADFPDSFFNAPNPEIRVSFSYTVSGGTYSLGFSLVPESERVTLNGEVLTRDTDYMIDYEAGLLILLVEVEDNDVIQVDYERFSGGLGGGADYARYFYGLLLDLPLSERFSLIGRLLEAADDPSSLADPQGARTMPNRHTVGGLVGSVNLPDFTGSFTVGYARDRFPFDDNQRAPLPNRIEAIASGSGYLFVGHAAGLNVYRDGGWSAYGMADGLSGQNVRAIAVSADRLYLGTNAGLTVVSLIGASSLDRVDSWARYYKEDGLPDDSVRSLFISGGRLWVGTDAGIASVPLAVIDDPSAWTAYTDDRFTGLGAILSLAGSDGYIYLGTESGLYRFSPDDGEIALLPGTEGAQILDLLTHGNSLYAASNRGLRVFHSGIGAGWLTLSEPVYSLGSLDGAVYYGTDDGLVCAADRSKDYAGWRVTAIGIGPDGSLWAGSQADADYTLFIWRMDDMTEAFDNDAAKIRGQDPSGFIDIPADQHTAYGGMFRASFDRSGDGFSLSGSVESISPGYSAIGSFGRQDTAGWELTGTISPWENTSLTASHSYHMDGLHSGSPRARLENDISFSASFGPRVSVSAHQEGIDTDPQRQGAESSYLSYRFSLADTLFNDALNLSLVWNDGFTDARDYGMKRRENSLSAKADLTLSPDLSISGSWSRPIEAASESWSGQERWSLTAHSGVRVGFIAGTLDYSLGRSRGLPDGRYETAHKADIGLDLDPFELAGWRLIPRSDFTIEYKGRKTDLSGRGTINATLGSLTVRTTIGADLSGLGAPLRTESGKVSVAVNYSGIEGLRPSLTYTQNRNRKIYEGVGKLTSVDHSLNGRMTWAREGWGSDQLSLTVRISESEGGARVNGSIDNSYRIDITDRIPSLAATQEETGFPTLNLTIETTGECRFDGEEPDLSVTIRGRGDIALSSTWSGSLSVSYLTGTKDEGKFYHSLILALTVAAQF